MAGETQVTVVGNLTADPELRFTDSGRQVASFDIASTPRRREGEKWVDGDPLFMHCNLWGPPAENLAASFHKGDRVVALGSMIQRNWTDREGNKRVSIELNVTDIGASVTFATVEITRRSKSNGGGRREQPPPPQDPRGSAPATGSSPQRPANDDWD